MIVRNELDRYLLTAVASLAEFVDEIRILDDGSTDGTADALLALDAPVALLRHDESTFFGHEGHARQALLDWTLAGDPTHVLAIDADEIVADGVALRTTLAESPPTVTSWTLVMEEIWRVSADCLSTREDGGWRAHPVGIAWRVPTPSRQTRRMRPRDLRIPDRALACGRVPQWVNVNRAHRASGTEILHLGWACEADRVARHERYAVADGGRFHASAHLDSILWPDRKIRLRLREWPAAIDPEHRAAIAARAARGAA